MTDKETRQDQEQQPQQDQQNPQNQDQEKTVGDKAPETVSPQQDETETDGAKPTAEPHDRFKDATDNLKETTEKLWENTRQAWTTATFKAHQYKRLVQRKIDLSALHKKISATHGDLGRLVDDLRERGEKNSLETTEATLLLERLDGLKAEAAMLEEEIDAIKSAEHPGQDDGDNKS